MDYEKDDRYMPSTSEKRKYPAVAKLQPDVVYKIEPIGGMRDDGTRWERPKIFDVPCKSETTGSTWTAHPVNCFITEIKYEDYKWIEGRDAERSWYVPYDILDEVRELVDNNLYPFYVRKTAGYGDSGKTKEIHELFTSLDEIGSVKESEVKLTQDTGINDDILTVLYQLVNDITDIKKMLKEK